MEALPTSVLQIVNGTFIEWMEQVFVIDDEIAAAAYGTEETAELIPLDRFEACVAVARESGQECLAVARHAGYSSSF